MGEVGGNGLGDEVEDADILLAAGFDGGYAIFALTGTTHEQVSKT